MVKRIKNPITCLLWLMILPLVNSCSFQANKVLTRSSKKYQNIKSGEVEIRRDWQNGYKVDTSHWVYSLDFYRNSDIASSKTWYHCMVHHKNTGFTSSRLYNGHSTQVVNWRKGKVYVDHSPGFGKKRMTRRLFPSYRWPFFAPKLFFLNWKIQQPELLESTDTHWVIHKGGKYLYINKADSLIDVIVYNKIQSDGAEYFDKYEFDIKEYNQIQGSDSSLFWIEDSILEGIIPKAKENIDPAELSKAPSWNLITQYGDSLSTDQLKGKVVLLDFWADGCAPCLKAMPKYEELRNKFGRDKFEVVGIYISGKDHTTLKAFLDERGITYPNVIALPVEPNLSKAYHRTYVPMLYLLDTNGNIVHTVEGISSIKFAGLESMIESLLEE